MLAWIYKKKERGEEKKKVINDSKKFFTERPQSLHPPQTSLQLWIHCYWTKEKLKSLGIDGKVIPIWENLLTCLQSYPGGQGSKGGCTHTRGASTSISLTHKQYQRDNSARASAGLTHAWEKETATITWFLKKIQTADRTCQKKTLFLAFFT